VVGLPWVLLALVPLRALPEPQALLQVQRLLAQRAAPVPWAPLRALPAPRAGSRVRRRLLE